MAIARVKVNQQAVSDLLRSPEVLADLAARGARIAAAAGPGHRVEQEIGPNRARVAVITDTTEAVKSEAKHRSLTRAVDAGR